MGVTRKPPWWKDRIKELESENKRLEDAYLKADRKIEKLESEVKDLYREMREQDREWSRRLADAVSAQARTAEDNLAALDSAMETEADSELEKARGGMNAYLAFINGGEIDKEHAPVHWAKDYMTQAAEEESVEDGD